PGRALPRVPAGMIVSYLTMVAIIEKYRQNSNLFIALSGNGRLDSGLKPRRMRLPFRSNFLALGWKLAFSSPTLLSNLS
ncbi:MAG: hypothetical protein AB1489_07550, partial [Acidobacteriota bacterium]